MLPRLARFASLTVGAALLAGAAACADSAVPTAPAAATRAAPAGATPMGPAFNVLAAGGYYSSFNFAEALDPTKPGGWALIAPTNWRPTDYDVALHSRDRDTWYKPEAFRAMHGTMCQPYQDPEPGNGVRADDAGSHAVHSYDDLNYRCRNHMMTALQSRGYGVAYVTPNALVDFTNGEATIKFALATLRTSGRDWVDIWITPWEDNLKLPLDANLPDLQGPPRRAIHVRMTAELTRSAFEAYYVHDFKEYKLPVATAAGYESILKPVSTRRDTFELKISKTRLSFGMRKLASPDGPAGAITWVNTPFPALSFTRGVVQFGHHSFNPALDPNPALPKETGGTWHWDDFQISPAVPFTIVPTATGAARHADAANPEVRLNAPIPANAYLRFAAYGRNLQVSLDGGPWVDARRQSERLNVADRFHSYWMPVTAGATRVRFRVRPNDDDDDDDDVSAPGVWFVRDVAAWSLGGGQAAAAAWWAQLAGGGDDGDDDGDDD